MPLLEMPVCAAELPRDPTQVVALFVVSQKLERDCIAMYAHSQRYVTAGVYTTADAFFRSLRSGSCPQVVALDVLLPEAELLRLLHGTETAHCVPRPKILLLTPFPETAAARGALHRLERYERLVRPYTMQTLFHAVYALGADENNARIYRMQSLCEATLKSLKADPSLSGAVYLKKILLCALLNEQELPLNFLYRIAGEDRNVDEKAVTSALNRLSAAMCFKHTEGYVALCRRCGRSSQKPLSNGRLIRTLTEELRTYL